MTNKGAYTANYWMFLQPELTGKCSDMKEWLPGSDDLRTFLLIASEVRKFFESAQTTLFP